MRQVATRMLTKTGRREDLWGLYFRSRWEANWARYLRWLVERGHLWGWQYEPMTYWFENIRRGSRHYTPDFVVIHLDGRVEYHEVKGWMDSKSRTKLKRMEKYYPKVTIRVVDQKEYRGVAKVVAPLIEGWE